MTREERIERAQARLKDPILRQACCEVYSGAMFCFESDKDAVHCMGVLMLGRLGALLLGDGDMSDYEDEEIFQAALEGYDIPDKEPVIQ